MLSKSVKKCLPIIMALILIFAFSGCEKSDSGTAAPKAVKVKTESKVSSDTKVDVKTKSNTDVKPSASIQPDNVSSSLKTNTGSGSKQQAGKTVANNNTAKPAAAPSKVTKSSGSTAAKNQVSADYVTIDIKSDTSVILPPTNVPYKSGDTVFSILKDITRQRGIQMEYSGTTKTAYVKGIDNLYASGQKGWMYNVNGDYKGISCGGCTVNKGDVIHWGYTLNLGKDLGASK